MLFQRDRQEEGAWWVSRETDDRVDHFRPCDLCDATMAAREAEERIWQEFKLCYECNTQLELSSAIAEIQDERPYNLDRELELITDESQGPS